MEETCWGYSRPRNSVAGALTQILNEYSKPGITTLVPHGFLPSIQPHRAPLFLRDTSWLIFPVLSRVGISPRHFLCHPHGRKILRRIINPDIEKKEIQKKDPKGTPNIRHFNCALMTRRSTYRISEIGHFGKLNHSNMPVMFFCSQMLVDGQRTEMLKGSVL